MKKQLINEITQKMLPFLNNMELEKLQIVLKSSFKNYEISEIKKEDILIFNNQHFVELFLAAKKIEGCSYKTLKYYRATINNTLNSINKEIKHIITDDLREYLTKHQEENSSSRVTIDNIRRILSSFFAWLEDEDYIVKSPVRRIHKVKTGTNIKETYSDEALELMRDRCTELRDLAMIDILASTGMRVGELVLLNREDINFNERECVVFGKGDKERIVYFDARTKIHLKNYLENRHDTNPALFVSLHSPYNNYLTSIDEKILLNTAINNNLEQQAQAIFKSWFVNFEPFGGIMPDDWDCGVLSDIVEFSNGYAFKSSELLNTPEENCFDVFKQGHINRGGGFNISGTKSWFPKDKAINLDKYILILIF